jgi:hypothetical protein
LRFEIADYEKIPHGHPQFTDMMTEVTAGLELVKQNDKFPALSLYKYTKAKMLDTTDTHSRSEVTTDETDISKHKGKDTIVETDGVVIKMENPRHAELLNCVNYLMKKHKVLAKDCPDGKKSLAVFKASKKIVPGLEISALQLGLSKCQEFMDNCEDMDAICKAMPCNEEESIIESKIKEVHDMQEEANSFIGALKVTKALIADAVKA